MHPFAIHEDDWPGYPNPVGELRNSSVATAPPRPEPDIAVPPRLVLAHVWRKGIRDVYEPATLGEVLTTDGGHVLKPGMTRRGRVYLGRRNVPSTMLRKKAA
jgi:hypothetical protein